MKKILFFLFPFALMFSCENPNNDNSISISDVPLVYDETAKTAEDVYAPEKYGLPNFTDAATNSLDAVVYIESEIETKTRYYRDYYDLLQDLFNGGGNGGRPNYAIASGSGVIISKNGYIVSNNHVVQDAVNIKITLNDRRTYQAKVVGLAPSADLALLKIDESNLPFLKFANSDKSKIGEWVLAIGNPYELNSTVTAGIISAKARNIHILSENMEYERPIESFIQTDAAINPGNSGGALINLNGDLLGINTAIASKTGAYIGYGFAIPANIAKKITEDLHSCGSIQSAYLGVGYAEMNAEVAKATNNTTKGLYVGSVNQNGSAFKAGLREKDVIIKLAGKSVNTSSELIEILAQYRPGDNIFITLKRNGTEKELSVVLQDKNGNTNKPNIIFW